MQDLTVSLLQCELAWEAPGDNRRHIEELVADMDPGSDLLVLPEMFTTCLLYTSPSPRDKF